MVVGESGNDILTGGIGSDNLYGGDGFDSLFTHSTTASDFLNEKDNLFGGAGSDGFNIGSNYLSGTSSTNPTVDTSYAIIRDYNASQDRKIGLKSALSNYTFSTVGSYVGSGVADTRVWFTTSSGVQSLVLLVQDSSLNASNFFGPT